MSKADDLFNQASQADSLFNAAATDSPTVVAPAPPPAAAPGKRRWDRGLFAPMDVAENNAGVARANEQFMKFLPGFLRTYGPSAAGMTAAAMVPGGATWGAAIPRVIAAQLAATGADAGAQAMGGGPVDWGQAGLAGGEVASAQAGGEALAGAAGLTAKGLANLATLPTVKMVRDMPGVKFGQEMLDRGIASSASAKAARIEAARVARRMAAAASRRRSQSTVTTPTVASETRQMFVPGTVASAEGFNIPATKTTLDVAKAAQLEAQSASAINRVAKAHGYETQELIDVLGSSNPLDLAQAARRGLSAGALADLRVLLENVGGHAKALADATSSMGVSVGKRTVFSPTTARVPVAGEPVSKTVSKPAVTLSVDRVVNSPEISALRRELKRGGEADAALAELDKFLSDYAASNATTASPVAWYRRARTLQNESRRFYGKGGEGKVAQVAASPTKQAASAALASAIKRELGSDNIVPGLGAADRETQILIGIERALANRSRLAEAGAGLTGAAVGAGLGHMSGFGAAADIPAALATGAAARYLTLPDQLAWMAQVANSPSVQAGLRGLPPAALYGFQAITDTTGRSARRGNQ